MKSYLSKELLAALKDSRDYRSGNPELPQILDRRCIFHEKN